MRIVHWNLAAAVVPLLAIPAAADTIGMVMDMASTRAIVFNADTDTVIGSIGISGPAVGDCAITPDGKLALATGFAGQVWVIDLSTLSLASGTNPIPIANAGEDVSISGDGKYAVVCDGSGPAPVSVVDIAARSQRSTFSLAYDCNSVDVCQDNSVLVTSAYNNVRRLVLSGAGTLTDTGDSLPYTAMNATCAPGSRSGLAMAWQLQSFTIPGLGLVSNRSLGGLAVTALVYPSGDRVAVRRYESGAVDVFAYNSTTGELGASPLLSIPVPDARGFFGMEQMAIHPNGTKLYVPQPGRLNIYDATTGALLKTITNGFVSSPTGICFPNCAPPVIGSVSAEPSILWPANHKLAEVTVGYTDVSACPASCKLTVASNEPANASGDGNTSPDWQIIDAHRVLLRAERAGSKTDRLYTITVTCTNTAGQRSTNTATVVVPHDAGK